MPVGIYRKIAVPVQAIQWDGENEQEVAAFTGAAIFGVLDDIQRANCDDPTATAEIFSNHHATWVLVYTGDWIIREIDGNGFYPCRDDIFHATYIKAELPDG